MALLFVAAPAHATADRIAGPLPATVLGVVDGDTLRLSVPVWIGQRIEVLVRIRGVDAPEVRARCPMEAERARAATDLLARLVASGHVAIANVEGDKYFGRVLADVITEDGGQVAPRLLSAGTVRPYDGRRREGWCQGS